MFKRFVVSLLLAGASSMLAAPRAVDLRGVSLEDLTARLAQGSGDGLAAAASERAARMSGLVKTDPGKALAIALPDSARALLSLRVRDFIEQWVEVEGDLQVLIEDRADGSRRLTFLQADSGERYALYFAASPTAYTTGTRVRVSGLKVDSAIAVASGASDVRRVTTGLSTSSVEATSALTGTTGVMNTAVILVNFSDSPASRPYTAAAIQNVMATTSNFDLENSYGQTWLTYDVYGYYTIALTSSVCDYNTLSSQARAAATAAGVNLANYNRYLFSFPSNSCAWWGLGTVGGNPATAWVNGSFELMVVGHEMGHNFGLDHSHSLDCGSVVLGTSCTMSEYGDSLDIMGSSSPYHFNSYQKERLGWLGYGSSPALTTVTASGTYTINAMETNSAASKALKIARGTTGSFFYVEARRGLGFDAGVSGNANVTNGVVVHLASPSDPNSSDLLDMTAGTTSWADPALDVGQSYTDSVSGVTIAVASGNSSSATVTVTMGGTPPPPPPPSCTHANPTVSLSPGQSAGVKAGTAVSFTVSVTNNDVSPCTSSTFSLTGAVPAGWTGTLTAASLSAAPGATATTTFKVTSPASASNNNYAVTVTARNSAATSAAGSGSAVYVVNNPVSGSGGTFSDSFDRPDSADLGPSWTETAGNLVIAGNMVKNALGATGLNQAVVAGLAGATQTVDADFTSMDNNLGPKFGLILRYQDPKNYYLVHRVTGGSSRLYISRVVNGVQTDLAYAGISNPVKGVAFHITARVSGTTLSLDFGGVNKLNVNDSTFASGKVGIQIINSTTTIQQEADNFKAVVQ